MTNNSQPQNPYKLILRGSGGVDNSSRGPSPISCINAEGALSEATRLTLGLPTFAISSLPIAAFSSIVPPGVLCAQKMSSESDRGRGEPGGVKDSLPSLGDDGSRRRRGDSDLWRTSEDDFLDRRRMRDS